MNLHKKRNTKTNLKKSSKSKLKKNEFIFLKLKLVLTSVPKRLELQDFKI